MSESNGKEITMDEIYTVVLHTGVGTNEPDLFSFRSWLQARDYLGVLLWLYMDETGNGEWKTMSTDERIEKYNWMVKENSQEIPAGFSVRIYANPFQD
jgi:hypothetical protein